MILAVWTVCFFYMANCNFRARRRELEKLLQETYALKQRYLIAEVMKEPRRADDKVFYQMLRLAQRSMLEEVEEVHRQQLEYQEYVEQWVHEIKTPLTAMKLLCENQLGPSSRPMLAELEKTRRCTERPYTMPAVPIRRQIILYTKCPIGDRSRSDWDNKVPLTGKECSALFGWVGTDRIYG